MDVCSESQSPRTVLEALAGKPVAAAEKGTAHAPTDTMVEAGLFVADQLAARIGHFRSLTEWRGLVNGRIVAPWRRRYPKDPGCPGVLNR